MSFLDQLVLEKHLKEYRAASATDEESKPPRMRRIELCGCPNNFFEHAYNQAARRPSQRNKIHAKLKQWIKSGRRIPHAEVKSAWKAHSSLREFAKHFSIRTPFAARVLDTYGFGFSETLAHQYRSGELLPQIADEQGISQKFLVKLIEATGTKVSKGRRRPMYDEEKIAVRYTEVKSVRRIQVEFGMSWATANKILKELGLK